MTVILVRHGQTDANGACYAGRTDVPLNAEGRRQAEALVKRLAGRPVDRILTSPLRRAAGTAAPLARDRHLVPETCDALQELDFGDLEGRAKAEVSRVIRKAHLQAPIEGGESLMDIWMRLDPVAARLTRCSRAGERVAVFGHYWSLRLLAGRLRRDSLEDAAKSKACRLGNGDFAILTPDGAVAVPETGQGA